MSLLTWNICPTWNEVKLVTSTLKLFRHEIYDTMGNTSVCNLLRNGNCSNLRSSSTRKLRLHKTCVNMECAQSYGYVNQGFKPTWSLRSWDYSREPVSLTENPREHAPYSYGGSEPTWNTVQTQAPQFYISTKPTSYVRNLIVVSNISSLIKGVSSSERRKVQEPVPFQVSLKKYKRMTGLLTSHGSLAHRSSQRIKVHLLGSNSVTTWLFLSLPSTIMLCRIV